MTTARSIQLGHLAALAVMSLSGLPAVARDSNLASRTLAAAQTVKQQPSITPRLLTALTE
jgi:hypothetical protein